MATDYGNGSASDKGFHSGSVNEAKKITVDEKMVAEPLDEYGMPDKLKVTKSLVIRKAELMAKQYDTWFLKSLFLFSAFLCSFGYGLDGNIRGIYMTYAMNSYSTHSLISTVGVISMVISAVAQVIYAGLSDVFGRLSLFIVSIVFYVVGTIIQSQAYDVQRYAAGSVFYSVGLVGVMLQVILVLSDNSSLKWRLFYTFVPAWPSIITTWVSGNVIETANPEDNWSWNIAMWAFIFPLSCIPLIACMLHMRWKVRNEPEWKELQTEKTYYQSHGLIQTVVQLFWKLDVVGIILLTVGTGCILVPLTLAGGVSTQWQSAKLIAPFVLGFVLIAIFIYWESKLALAPIAPFKMLKDRGIWAPLWIMFLIAFVYQMAAGYLYTILMVAVDETDLSATRITSLYSFVSAIFAPVLGFIVARSSRLKPYMVLGCSLYFVTMGLFYRYRVGKDAHQGVIGAMVVWGICSCLFDYPVTVSIQSVTSHENMATVTALSYTIFSIGGAVAASVSGAIWTQLLYPKLLEYIGDADLAEAAYSSPLTFYLDYPWGTPIRDAMVEAYKHVQKYEVLIALVFTAPMFILTFCLRDPSLTDDVAQKLNDGEYVETSHDDPISEWVTSRFSKLRHRE
ncbi:siderophore transporter TDEL_0H00130 [Torulaspora delbrueckii]|uniref:Major facilitator superfamily (MFS) profile domain-containing protein n=1 Tax=Torulaspora delbrueckii TaxID=4950 RepID=G8ZZ28_TORDE|nr:hypothetical protein TDEL_0H00130 [Torulaspora delbrueckii]CCE93872.1 hypothetical protein TDEL_0H00130 [Torulaspora delbrueckii]